MKITIERLQEILLAHSQWLNGVVGETYADFRCADLRGADLRCADLRCADLRGADLRGADLRCADLRGADLRGAYLRGADLRGADLRGADLRDAYLRGAYLTDANGKKILITKTPIQIANLHWFVTIWDAHMQIGCEFHSHAEWSEFDDERIRDMASEALDFWREWKDILMAMCKKHGREEA